MKLYRKIIASILLTLVTLNVLAFEPEKFTHQIVVGYNFGATAPLPIPREVRNITSYWPQFTPQLGYNVSYQVLDKWSVQSGITLDTKGMGVQDRVKYMYTDIEMDGTNIKGYFTGRNETKVKISYVTVPIRVAYNLTPTWKIRTGGYFAYRNSSEFNGTVWDGYIRETSNNDDDIVHSLKIDIINKNDATFDFGKEMRNFDMGVSLGFEHKFIGRFGLYGDATYSLTPIFPSSFTGIDMKMRNIYVVLGVTYTL